MAQKKDVNRRDFLRNASTAGLASIVASTGVWGQTKEPNAACTKAEKEKTEKPKTPQVPRKILGKTGIDVPILNFGGTFDISASVFLLQKALDWGVNYWDTAYGYANGNSEIGIGMFLKKNPELRKKIFIVSKGGGPAKKMDSQLVTSLERMNTDYIDLYYLHGLNNPKNLNEELKNWSLEKKKQGKIRFFGFSTHTHMAKCLMAASKCDWIDALMTRYNFRHRLDPEIQTAVNACHKANIGLIAMKTQGGGPIKPDAKEDQQLAGHFLKQGYTEHQAKLKAIWQDKRFTTICSKMTSVAILGANVAAAMDKTTLSQADMDVLDNYARATCNGYCTGCAEICQGVAPDVPYISEVMRYMMYANAYGDQDTARELFRQIPSQVRNRLARADYSRAEARCPQHLPIAKIIAQATKTLA